MLETIRRNTFETNSSSCHSVTTMPTDLWTQFKNHEVVFKKGEWDIECHTSISTVLNEDNIKYVAIPFDKYYQSFHSALLEGKDETIKKIYA